MRTHTEGYVTDLAYLGTFQRELTPDFIRFCLLTNGVDLPARTENEPFRYLELGYGQGLSLNIHAAASTGEFWGTDFMQEHADNAQGMADAAKLNNVKALNMSFAELDAYGSKGNLPTFDLITLHGVWSWINAENRKYIQNIIDRHLKPGGVVYLSYNAQPGWASFMPVRELLIKYADATSAHLDSGTQTQEAFAFARNFAETKTAFFMENNHLKDKLISLKNESVQYLAHEYMNRNWQPFYFDEVEKDMNAIGCSFVTSMHSPIRQEDYLPAETLSILNATQDATMREIYYDFAVNRTFRADLFMKDMKKISSDEQQKRINDLHFVLSNPLVFFLDMHRFTIPTHLGSALLKEETVVPLLATIAEKSGKPKTLDYLRNSPRLSEISHSELFYLVTVLTYAGYLFVAQPEFDQKKLEDCARLNRVLCEKAITEEGNTFLASPIAGTAIPATRMEQLFLLAYANGKKRPEDWAEFASKIYEQQNITVKDNNGDSLWPEEVLPHLINKAVIFYEDQFPYLRIMKALPSAE